MKLCLVQAASTPEVLNIALLRKYFPVMPRGGGLVESWPEGGAERNSFTHKQTLRSGSKFF